MSSGSVTLECDAIVFDLDGVLVDSGQTVVTAWRQLCAELGIDLDAITHLHGVRTVDALPADLSRDAASHAERRLEVLEVELSAHAKPVTGALPFVTSLPPDRWGIATSGSLVLATARLRAAGIPVPRVLVTADDVANGKPDPEPYAAACDALGVPASRAVVFEDAPSGAAAARAAGAAVVGVATTYDRGEFDAATWVDDLAGVAVRSTDPLTVRIES